MRASMTLLACLGLLGTPAQASAVQPTKHSPGLEKRIDALFADYRGDRPGCAVGVFEEGRILFSKGYGLANLDKRSPITPSTVFDVASLSKQFTAFSIALLARDGRISLDDQVQRYVPELPRLGSGSPITIRHLVHHTSGLREYGALKELSGWRLDEPLTKDEALDLLKRQKGLNFEPGAQHEYNNSNYLLMGLIIERVSGRPLQEQLAEQIFRPLGMANTHIRYPTDPIPERAVNYSGRVDGSFVPNRVWDRAYAAGVANVHTSIEDLARWDRNFFHPTVGDEPLINLVTTPGRLASGDATYYAFGLDVGTHGGRRIISHGGMGGGSFHLLRFPEEKLGVATLCNRYSLGPGAPDTWTLSRKVADVFLPPNSAKIAFDAATHVEPAKLSHYAGTYWTSGGAPLRIATDKGKLVEIYGGEPYPLVATGPGTFRDAEGLTSYRFSDLDGGTLTYHEIPTGVTRKGQRYLPWVPSSRELDNAAGTYCNSEVQLCWSLRREGDRLLLRRPAFRDALLTPIVAGTFIHVDKDDIGERWTRIVLKDLAGRAAPSFTVSRGRVSHVLFERLADAEGKQATRQ